MPGLHQPGTDAGSQVERRVVGRFPHLPQHLIDVIHVKGRREGLLAGALAFAVDALDVLLLELGAVAQNQTRQFDGRRCGVDRPPITRLDQQRQTPRVVEMPVGQDDRVKRPGGQPLWHLVEFVGFA